LERTKLAMQKRQEREDRRRSHRFARLLTLGRVTPAEAPQPTLVSEAKVERGHLDERLGLFVIIVLGEAVAQVVSANSDVVWTRPTIAASLLAFLLLVGLWRLTTLYGFSTAPRTTAPLEPSIALAAHLGVTAAMIAIAAGLGGLIMEAGEHLATVERSYLFGGLAVYFVVSLLSGIAGRAPLKWFLGWALPSLLASVAVAVFGHPLPAWSLALIACVILLWFSTYNSLAGHGPLREFVARLRKRGPERA
jgi:low temperature requirement protein LtrA